MIQPATKNPAIIPRAFRHNHPTRNSQRKIRKNFVKKQAVHGAMTKLQNMGKFAVHGAMTKLQNMGKFVRLMARASWGGLGLGGPGAPRAPVGPIIRCDYWENSVCIVFVASVLFFLGLY